eukprot:3937065-Rhodomonas_salina.3
MKCDSSGDIGTRGWATSGGSAATLGISMDTWPGSGPCTLPCCELCRLWKLEAGTKLLASDTARSAETL